MAFSSSTSNPFGLTSPTPLQMLIDEINFQRQKEMRQLLKDDSGFVVLQGTTWYTDLFVRHFLFQAERSSIESDDLLFFVRKKHIRGTSRNAPKYETELEVFRKDSKKLPIGDPDVDWEETVYLNLVIHQFDYTLTLAICTRTSPKELQVLRRHSQKVYASPSRRKMDSKGDSETITYPHICFMIDNFDEVFHDILVRDGEMVCVELVAKDRDGGAVQGVIFLGSIRYDALKKVYDARQSSLSTKVAQRMTFGLFSSGAGPQTRCEFVRMKGPQGKGHAEMAVTKPKGSGVETPTSEPGFCATDMWDSEWEEDIDEYNYRHQRRLSDPSANLNYFSNKYAWRAKEKDTTVSYGASKARSEQEGLDCLASEVSEIESGDLRDDRPASLTQQEPPLAKSRVTHLRQKPALSASESALNNKNLDEKKKCTQNSSCCDCFPSPKKRWSDSGSAQMSDVYVAGEHRTDFSSPACLNHMNTRKSHNLLSIESEIEFRGAKNAKNGKKTPSKKSPVKKGTPKKRSKNYEIELADEACAESDPETSIAEPPSHISTPPSVNGKHGNAEKCQKTTRKLQKALSVAQTESISDKSATSSPSNTLPRPKGLNRFFTYNRNKQNKLNENTTETSFITSPSPVNKCEFQLALECAMKEENDLNGNPKIRSNQCNTLPRMKKSHFHPSILYSRGDGNRTPFKVPKRTTTDGTTIYYWCDVPKKQIKELDDGAYNPLWTSRGFTQTFHFWKENKRQQSTPLNAFLTYVTLPWWSIAKDLLDHRETPILTF
ncbi:uncharacterized protein LOC134827854 [Culicoides brevitarsis]|uniref:uncharacterized protein LOC134827854 n=1 Tax=Culicoides brevitarsis TaxID=469753 RepID=UPI00307B1C77